MSHEKYFQAAAEVAKAATCKKARCGTVIVSKDGHIIGHGYNAPPLEDESQRMCGADYDLGKKPKSDKTCCVHAEWNAILTALKNYPDQVTGSTLYFMRVDENGDLTAAGKPYCTVCSRLALQSGIAVFGLWDNGAQMIPADEYNLLSYDYHK